MKWIISTFAVWIVLLLASASAANAHPFHASIAEAEWNPKNGKLEVAMWVHPSDLEKAISLLAKKPIDLDNAPDVDKHIAAYLNKVVIVKDANGKRQKIQWVGKEITVKAAWLYFQVPLKDGLMGVHIQHRLFFDLLDDQVNTINFRDRRTRNRMSLSFSRERPTRLFSWNKSGAAKKSRQ